MRNTYRTTSVPEHVTIASSSMEIWLFEIRIILTFREVRTCDSFLKRKLENRALTGCRLDPVLSWSAISFELHAKMAEEIRVEKCNFRKFRSPVTLTLTLGRVKVTSAYSVRVRLPARPTVWLCRQAIRIYMAIWSSCNIEISWSLNSCDSFIRRKFENWALTRCRLVPIQSSPTISFELHLKMAVEINLE